MTVYTSNSTGNPLEQMDNLQLASYIYHAQRKAAEHREEADRASQVLIRRMDETGATAVDHPQLTVKLEMPSPTYDITKLRRLYEVAPKEEVDKAVTPAHDEVVHIPEKWSAVKFKPLLKYGVEVFDVINAAMLPGGPPRLRITPKA